MYVIRSNGDVEFLDAVPSLKDAQRIVGGYIQYCPMPAGSNINIIVNEEGLIMDLPFNQDASRLFKDTWLSFHDVKELSMNMLTIVGDAIVLPAKEQLS